MTSQRVTLITLGAADLDRSTAFYRALGCFLLSWRAPRVAFPQAGDEAVAAAVTGGKGEDMQMATPVKHNKAVTALVGQAKEMTTPLLEP